MLYLVWCANSKQRITLLQDLVEKKEKEFSVRFSNNKNGLGVNISKSLNNLDKGMIPYCFFFQQDIFFPFSLWMINVSIKWILGDLESSGFGVKSILKEKAVDQDGQIHIGDGIIAVSSIQIFIFYISLLSLCMLIYTVVLSGLKQFIAILFIFQWFQS